MPILIKGSGGAQEAPVITVSSSGLITAKAGDETATKQLPTQAGKTVTPGTYAQTAVSSGKYTTGSVTVKGDPNLNEYNMPVGYSCFGTEGRGAGCCCGWFIAENEDSASFDIYEWTNTPAQAYARVHAVFILDSNREVKQYRLLESSSTNTTIKYIDVDNLYITSRNYFEVSSTSIDIVIGDTTGFTFRVGEKYYYIVIYDGMGSHSAFA